MRLTRLLSLSVALLGLAPPTSAWHHFQIQVFPYHGEHCEYNSRICEPGMCGHETVKSKGCHTFRDVEPFSSYRFLWDKHWELEKGVKDYGKLS